MVGQKQYRYVYKLAAMIDTCENIIDLNHMIERGISILKVRHYNTLIFHNISHRLYDTNSVHSTKLMKKVKSTDCVLHILQIVYCTFCGYDTIFYRKHANGTQFVDQQIV